MLLEGIMTRLDEVCAEVCALRDRLEQLEATVASTRVQTATGAKTTATTQPASATTSTTAKASR